MKEQWVQYGLPSGEGEIEIVKALKNCWHLKSQLSELQRLNHRIYTTSPFFCWQGVPTVECRDGRVLPLWIQHCPVQTVQEETGETIHLPAIEREDRREDMEMAVTASGKSQCWSWSWTYSCCYRFAPSLWYRGKSTSYQGCTRDQKNTILMPSEHIGLGEGRKRAVLSV